MENQIADYLNLTRDYAREAFTIGYLEGELRKRKIRSTRLQKSLEKQKANLESLLTPAQRQDATDLLLGELQHLADSLIEEYKLKLRLGDCSWAMESDEPPDLVFDDPNYDLPNVCVLSANATPVVVKVRESLIAEPKNIGNTFIAAAIHRYVDRLSLPGPSDLARRRDMRDKLSKSPSQIDDPLTRKEAEDRLKCVFDALLEGAKLRAHKDAQRLNDVMMMLTLSNDRLSEDRFSTLASVLNSAPVKGLERSRLTTNLRNKLIRDLPAIFPESETCKEVLAFLFTAKIPKKRTGASLRNAFFAFERKVDHASFRKYKSQVISQLRQLTSGIPDSVDLLLNEKEVERIVEPVLDRMLLHRGVGKLDRYEDPTTSKLVLEAFNVAQANPTSRQ